MCFSFYLGEFFGVESCLERGLFLHSNDIERWATKFTLFVRFRWHTSPVVHNLCAHIHNSVSCRRFHAKPPRHIFPKIDPVHSESLRPNMWIQIFVHDVNSIKVKYASQAFMLSIRWHILCGIERTSAHIIESMKSFICLSNKVSRCVQPSICIPEKCIYANMARVGLADVCSYSCTHFRAITRIYYCVFIGIVWIRAAYKVWRVSK